MNKLLGVIEDESATLGELREKGAQLGNSIKKEQLRQKQSEGRLADYFSQPEISLSIQKCEALGRASSISEALKLVFEIAALWDLLKNRVGSDETIVESILMPIDELQRPFYTLIEKYKSKTSNQIDSERIEFASIVTAFGNELERNKKELTEFKSEIIVQTHELENYINKRLEDIDKLYVVAQENLNTKEREIDDFIGTLTAKGMQGGYANIAEAEKSAADSTRTSAFKAMKYSAWAAGFIVAISLLGHSPSFGEAVFRAAALIVISGPAVYMARESKRHRDQQNHLYQTALDIAGVPPYLRTLDKDVKDAVLKELAPRLFDRRQNQAKEDLQLDSISKEALFKVIDKIPTSPKT